MKKKFLNKIVGIFVVIFCLSALGGCPQKGPLEKTGERADEIIDNVGDGDPILHKKGPLEKAGEAVDDTIDDANN